MTPEQILLLDKALTMAIMAVQRLMELSGKTDDEILAMLKDEELRSDELIAQLKE